MKPDPAADLELVERLREGDDLALNTLIERWEKSLFGYAWRYTGNTADSQDLVAETFVRLYNNRTRLRAGTNLSAWLFTTLSNLCHNRYRWLRRHPSVSIEETTGSGAPAAGQLAARDSTPSDSAVHDESVLAIRDALDRLPHDLKVTVLLYYFEQRSYREIAEICCCSERGVETRLYRARRRLKKDLEPGLLTSFAG